MASTYVNNLRLNEMGTGDQSGTWGTVTNTNLELIGEALGYGTEAITTNADTHLSTVADGSTDAARAMYVKYTGALDSTCTVTIAPNTMKRVQIIENATSGSQSIIVKQGSGATITVPNGTTKICVLDGAGSGAAVIDALENLSITGDLTIEGDDLKMGTNTSGHVLVADGTNYNPVAMSGDATIAANGAITIADDAVGADQLASNAVVNASIASGAAIAFSKMANLTINRALTTNSDGDIQVSNITADEINYLDGLSSNIQGQLDNKTTISSVYPVGSIYINASNSTNPGTLLGFGTWAAFGAGRVPVGIDSSDSDFDTAEETGGAKTHTLTTSELPAHTHTVETKVSSSINGTFPLGSSGSTSQGTRASGSTGSGSAHNNVQPYIVVYMWKRTA